MAPVAPRYLLVMRHAERQDEVDDSWAVMEAGRQGARPWDPPLSSRGLEQAAEAASRLASWQHHTGVRIVAVVTSPFLRCLQTSAAVCRRLGIERLQISWLLSEALCRIAAAPAGPLPLWMWPRSPVQARSRSDDGAGSSSCTCGEGTSDFCSAEEFLAQLGAVVAPEASSGGAPGERDEVARQRGDTARDQNGEGAAAAPATGGEGSSDAAAGVRGDPCTGRVLQGFLVSVLPPTLDDVPHLSALGVAAPAPDADTDPIGTCPTGHGPETSQLPPDGAVGAERGQLRGPCTKAETEQQGAPGCRPCPLRMDVEGPDVAPRAEALGGDDNRARPASPQRQAEGDGRTAPNQSNSQPADCAPGAAERYSQTTPGVPYSPEALEEAHARYRAALRCLMAATEFSDTARDSREGSDAAASARGSTLITANRDVGQQGLGPWRTLWWPEITVCRAKKSSTIGLGASSSTAADGDSDSGCELQRGTTASAATPPAFGNARTPPPGESAAGGAGSHGGVCDSATSVPTSSSQVGRQDEDQGKDTGERDAGLHMGPPGPDMRQSQRGRQPGACSGEAVLVVTHGEAVACAATMVAPWALVYEVRHTGFVVLASGRRDGADGEEHEAKVGQEGEDVEDDADEAQLPVRGCSSSDAAWCLVPDHGAERGVLWMSAF